jgi:hypothetical protein
VVTPQSVAFAITTPAMMHRMQRDIRLEDLGHAIRFTHALLLNLADCA